MTLQSRLTDLVAAVGADIKDIRAKAIPPLVSALPTTGLFDGKEVYYQNAAMATSGQVWKLRYRSASLVSFKWEFVGGSDLYSRVYAGEQTASLAFTDLTTVGPQLTLPLAGDYLLSWGFLGYQVAASDAYMSLSIAGGPAQATDMAALISVNGVVPMGTGHEEVGYTFTQPNTTLLAKYKVQSGGTMLFSRRFLRAKPVRLI